MVYGKRDRHWRPLTWGQMGRRVNLAAAGLCGLGVERGGRVAIVSDSGPEWVLADLAIQSAGAVSVPAYETSTPDQLAWLLEHAECRQVFVHNRAQLDKVLQVAPRLPQLAHVIHLDERILEGRRPTVPPGVQVQSLLELEQRGDDPALLAEVEARVAALTSDDLLTIIYTSGTTGVPKGVMLTHGNLIANCEGAGRALAVSSDDVLLSFLPLSHSFERMAGYYMSMLFCGATVYFAEGMGRLIQNMAEVRPTVVTGVPRVYEKIYARFMATRGQAGLIKRGLADLALSVGRRMSKLRQSGREPGRLLEAGYRLTADQVFSGLRERLGGRLRFLVSGGAPLAPEIAAFFHAAGLLLLEGYGLTETSPVVSVNRLSDFRFGTVGRPLDNVRVRLAEDGEILVKGPSVMRGYYKDAAATARVLDAEGWLATGDIGVFEPDGKLRITDRKKDLFKTASGKYIAPQHLERLLTGRPLVEQACVIGDRRPYCVALIVPDLPALSDWARESGLDWRSTADLLRLPAVRERFGREVEAVNAELARHETLKKFDLLADPFTEAEGLLTPSQKVRRKQVLTRYAVEIEALYSESSGRLRMRIAG
ncbi:MAG: long-chain fatty acid--CoA ligase [Myxococcales bacterium]|nr:long-chain fatty acid--CoA ligase [Myxococcales bacterium]